MIIYEERKAREEEIQWISELSERTAVSVIKLLWIGWLFSW